MRQVLLIAHAPSDNTRALRDAVVRGVKTSEVCLRVLAPLECGPEDIRAADALILGTTENLGYMAGLTKDLFDRCYYPVLEDKQGLPVAIYIRAGHDGTGTKRGLESIMTGLRWRSVQEPLILRGPWQDGWRAELEELGQAVAQGLEMGVF